MLRRALNFFRRDRLEAEFREELEFHLSQTRGTLGNPGLVQDHMRDASTLVWLETLLQDLRYGVRQLSSAPVLVGVAVLSLALGIGANTAIFTLINAVMLQYLPVHDPARLVLFYDGINDGWYSGTSYLGDEFPIRHISPCRRTIVLLKNSAPSSRGRILPSAGFRSE